MDTKTRLIDADKLDIYDISPAMGFSVMGVTEEDIALAEPIDAIPVEWLEEQRDKSSGFRHAVLSETLEKWEGEKDERL